MPDEHVHEVTLDDGQVIRTGPPIYAGAEPPAGPEPEPMPTPPQGMRAGHKVRQVNVPDPEQQQEKEAGVAKQALATRSRDLLPAAGREIWDRMYSSARRVFTGDGVEEYAQKLAWRAVVQKYELQWPADMEPPDPASRMMPEAAGTSRSAPAGPRLPATPKLARAKVGSHAYGTADRRGGSFIVPCSPNREDKVALYQRVVTVPIPGTPGASVRVGLWSAGRNLIDVSVPSNVVYAQPGEEDMHNKAYSWVLTNWRNIIYAAKDWLRPHEKAAVPWMRWARRSKLVTDPTRAKDRISWGPALVPFEVDLQGQYATEQEVERVAHEFLLYNGKIGIMHGRWKMDDGQPPGRVVESFIARTGDPHFPTGAWILGIKWHPAVWPEVEAGKLKGLSIGGAWGAESIRLYAQATAEVPYEQAA